MPSPFEVILHPVITEKSTDQMEENNVYTFLVDEEATKHQIQSAVEKIWDVKVRRVRTMRLAGKYRKGLMGQLARNWKVGRRNDIKKALVTLQEGDHIEFYEVG